VAKLSVEIFKLSTARVSVSASIYVVSQASLSFASSSFRLAMALAAESGSLKTMPRYVSCSMSATK
jgi:hypothetical protein